MFEEPILGEGARTGTDELRGAKAAPGSGLYDQGPLGGGEADGARVAWRATIWLDPLPRPGVFLSVAGQQRCSVAAGSGRAPVAGWPGARPTVVDRGVVPAGGSLEPLGLAEPGTGNRAAFG